MTAPCAPPASLVEALRAWLRPNGVAFFADLKARHGDVAPVLGPEDPAYPGWRPCPTCRTCLGGLTCTCPDERCPCWRARSGVPTVPHPVHLREGMQVRNWMRERPECAGWTDHELDDRWVAVVEAAIAPAAGGAP